MDKLSVKPEHLKILTDIFDSYCPNAEIWTYGSRVNGDCHEGSDLDLVVIDFHSPTAKLYELRELLRESNIPFLIDINEFNTLPHSFQNEIKRNYTVVYQGISS